MKGENIGKLITYILASFMLLFSDNLTIEER